MLKLDQKLKMYLAVGLMMVIIITAWGLNLKNSLKLSDTNKLSEDETLTKIAGDFTELINNVKNIKNELNQPVAENSPPDSTGLSPAEIDAFTERLIQSINASSTPTSTPTSTPNL